MLLLWFRNASENNPEKGEETLLLFRNASEINPEKGGEALLLLFSFPGV